MEFQRLKILFANLCCFILFTVFIYESQKYRTINISPEEENNMIHDNTYGILGEKLKGVPGVREIRSSIGHPISSKEYQRKLCELDRPNIDGLRIFNMTVKRVFNTKKVTDYINDFFHQFVQNPHRAYCKEIKRFGGQYNPVCKFTDGSKFVCMDQLLKDIENGECLIYSFGVADDWSFEDIMDELGCEVYALDGSIDHLPARGNRIHFEKSFVYHIDDFTKDIPMISLLSLLAKNGHTKTRVSYLKMDIEGNERKCLPYWFLSGALDNVEQIGLEFHLDDDIVRTNQFLKTLKYLYFKGNYRLISYEANGCAKNTETNMRNKYFNLAEIVLKKVSNQSDYCE